MCQFVFVVNNLLQECAHVFTDCLCTSGMDFKPAHLITCFTTTLVSYMCCMPAVINGLSFIAMHEHVLCKCPNSGKSCYPSLTVECIFVRNPSICGCLQHAVEMAAGNLSLKLYCKSDYSETWHAACGVGAVLFVKSGSVSCSLFIVQVP